MKPDRWDIVIDKIHEETKYEKKFIKDLMKFYWKRLRQDMMNMKSYRIVIEGFGTFEMSARKAYALKEKLVKSLECFPLDTVFNFKKKVKMEEVVKQIDHAIETYKEDKQKFIKIMEKRYGKYTPRLEKQKEHIRGNKEQHLQEGTHRADSTGQDGEVHGLSSH